METWIAAILGSALRTSIHENGFIRSSLGVCILALFCCALWGSAFSVIKIGYELFGVGSGDSASQILFAGCRFTLAGMLVIAFESIRSRSFIRPKRFSFSKVLILALFQTILQYISFYVGLAHTAGVKASIINGTSNVFAILLAVYPFRIEKLSFLKSLGCAFGLGGLIIVNLQGLQFDLSFSFMGEGLMIMTAVAAAVSTVLIRIFSESENPVVLSGYQFFTGGIVLILMGIVMGGSLHPANASAYLILFYLALVSSVAYSLWGILLKYNPVSKVTVYGFMTPVFGVILAALLLGEYDQLNILCLIALALVCLGIILTNKANADE